MWACAERSRCSPRSPPSPWWRSRPPGTATRSVLACRRRRGPLAALVVALSAVTAVRLAVLLAAAGLPAGPAQVALLFAALGGFGVLPIGIAAAPAAALAASGADAVTAGALGASIAGTTLVAVLAYGALALAASPWGSENVRSAA